MTTDRSVLIFLPHEDLPLRTRAWPGPVRAPGSPELGRCRGGAVCTATGRPVPEHRLPGRPTRPSSPTTPPER
ncbi:hypothetical protein QJS66_04515 [Kocuria rhizophila]|nr:hypothetical protein QJS66_04515 [Kocuria rhizophila]